MRFRLRRRRVLCCRPSLIVGGPGEDDAKIGTMQAVDVAVACCRRSGDAEADDLYPDPDAAPLRAALGALGITSILVAWDDPGMDWASASKVFVSSTWDGVDRPSEYLAWARHASAVSVLINPLPTLEWNLDKVHQRDLADDGIPMVPTTWVAPDDTWASPPGWEFVVKPSVSAGGRSTARYAAADPTGVAHVHGLQRAGQTVMVREYLATIDTQGETDLVYIDGTFSHAVVKNPVLQTGEGVVDRPWERIAWAGLVEPNAEQFAISQRTMEAVARRFDRCPLYGRVDLVNDSSGAPLVLEVELIDPYLSLDIEPTGATRLATALSRS